MDKSQYFYRTVVITRRNNEVALANIDRPEESSPIDGWLGVVLSLADGKHSVQELVDFMGRQYPGQPPADMEKTIESVLERLVDGKLVNLTEEPVELPYYLASPVEELDLEKARQLMKEDGYTNH